jgi:hypothetical protein
MMLSARYELRLKKMLSIGYLVIEHDHFQTSSYVDFTFPRLWYLETIDCTPDDKSLKTCIMFL